MEPLSKKTVAWTVQNGLCCSCGLCKNSCPAGCIRYERKNGSFFPVIDNTRCVGCETCAEICPGLEVCFTKAKEPLDNVYGEIRASYNAWSRSPELRHVSASGGVVSSLVERLLTEEEYDAAFCVNSYQYDDQLKTECVLREKQPADWVDSTLPKSRYLPVSHENAVEYLLKNREKRVILIGNACSVQGFRKVIRKFSLHPENYLLVGLFCDKVFNYNVKDYFQRQFAGEKRIAGIHFKNKESGGWPGNMKLLFDDGSSAYLDKSERGRVKDYFMPERCLYCVDKLNVAADISVGDNYTEQNSSPLGSNTVLIRTEQGERAWQKSCGSLYYESVKPEALRKAQFLDGRINNLYFSLLKQREIEKRSGCKLCINSGMMAADAPGDYEWAYKTALEKLRSGACYREDPEKLARQFRLEEKRRDPRNPAVLGRRLYYGIKRRLQG